MTESVGRSQYAQVMEGVGERSHTKQLTREWGERGRSGDTQVMGWGCGRGASLGRSGMGEKWLLPWHGGEDGKVSPDRKRRELSDGGGGLRSCSCLGMQGGVREQKLQLQGGWEKHAQLKGPSRVRG